MRQDGRRRLWLALAVFVFAAVAACAAPDYSDGIDSFSQAVIQASTTEQTLAAAAQQASLDAWGRRGAK
jgi:hypothetical protein